MMNNVVSILGNTSEIQKQMEQYAQTVVADPKMKVNEFQALEMFYSDDMQDRQHLYNLMKLMYGKSQAQVDKLIRREQVRQEVGYYPQHAKDFIECYVKKEALGVAFNGRFKRTKVRKVNGDDITEDDLEDSMLAAHYHIENTRNLNKKSTIDDMILLNDQYKFGFSRDVIITSIESWISKEQEKMLKEIADRIGRFGGHVGNNHNELMTQFVQRAFNTSDYKAEVVEAVIRKFIWQVKRKMFGLKITNHIMPVLMGGQGSGKTTLIRKLLEPIKETVVDTDFGDIEENRNISIWANYVFFFDEMAKANKTDMEKLKNCITSNEKSARILHSNSTDIFDNNATFIGCSNNELDQLIQDTTGNRRFFPIYMDKGWSSYWEWLDEIDPVSLWLSVDETADDPLLPFLDDIAEVQDAVRVKSPVEEWFLEHGEYWKNLHPQGILSSKLYNTECEPKCFRMWKENAYPHQKIFDSTQAFGAEMSRLVAQDVVLADKKRTKLGNTYKFL